MLEFLTKLTLKVGALPGYPLGVLERPIFEEEVWSPNLVISLFISELLNISVESEYPEYWGWVIYFFEEWGVNVLELKSKLSPEVKYETKTFYIWKNYFWNLVAFDISAMRAPLLP